MRLYGFEWGQRLRVLLHAGGVNWPRRPRPRRIRTRAPYSNAYGR